MKVGFIGLGIMGHEMAANLLKNGYNLIVYNRTSSKANSLVERGAVQASSPAGVGEQADVLFTMLSDPQAVQATAEGENGFLDQMKQGAIWADCSTVNPSFSRQMAAQAAVLGIKFLDAPVIGSRQSAEKCELTFYVGGPKKDVETCRPLFEAMGKRVVHIGEQGMGISIKICFNLMLGQAMLGLSEAIHLGESLGLPRKDFLDSIFSAPVTAPAVAGKRSRIENERFEPDFPMHLMYKDLLLAAQTGEEQKVPLPVTNTAKDVFASAVNAGFGDEDYSAVIKIFDP